MHIGRSGLCLTCGQHYTRAQHCHSAVCLYQTLEGKLISKKELPDALNQARILGSYPGATEGRVLLSEIPRPNRPVEQGTPCHEAGIFPVPQCSTKIQPAGNPPASLKTESEKRAELFERDGPAYDDPTVPDPEGDSAAGMSGLGF